MNPHRPPASPNRRTVGLLLCAMLLAQAVGLWHGVVHAPGPLHAIEGDAALPEPVGLERLFAHHDDGADCLALDQLSHADAPAFARPDPGVVHPVLPRLRAPPLPNVAAQASGFQARGPPALA
ncbi:MAG: hypothetical protein Q7U73_14505 [Rubrivivax sp.]|nr:hypothetical protein [Rubrivivax sp.]